MGQATALNVEPAVGLVVAVLEPSLSPSLSVPPVEVAVDAPSAW